MQELFNIGMNEIKNLRTEVNRNKYKNHIQRHQTRNGIHRRVSWEYCNKWWKERCR